MSWQAEASVDGRLVGRGNRGSSVLQSNPKLIVLDRKHGCRAGASVRRLPGSIGAAALRPSSRLHWALTLSRLAQRGLEYVAFAEFAMQMRR
jgi:hypothetical protein